MQRVYVWCLLVLTKDVDLTISNLLDGRTTYDDVNDDSVLSSTGRQTSSSSSVCLSVCLCMSRRIEYFTLEHSPKKKLEKKPAYK